MANLRANSICGTDGRNAITGSVFFDGNDYLTETSGASSFNASEGDWTIEAWMYCSDASQNDILVNATTSSNDRFYIQFIGQTIYIGDNTNNIIAIGGVKQVNSWFHVAVTKNSSTYRAFINGIQIGSSTTPLANYNLDNLTIGYRGSQSYYAKGFISNLRIIKGTALYTQNFIPPTRKLTRLPGTVLLCCQDNNSVTTEATGKTITANGNPTATKQVPQVGTDGGLVFDGATRVKTQNYFYLPTGTTEQRSRGRGVFGGGYTGTAPSFTNINTIDYIQIQSQGISQDFGDLTSARRAAGANSAASSPTRGLWGGGFTSSNINTIDYVTIASTGNATLFGNLTTSKRGLSSVSNSTRGVWGCSDSAPGANVLEYVTIATTGNAVDFGDLSQQKRDSGGCASSTRGVFAGGSIPASPNALLNTIEYITIASTGDVQDFGDLSGVRSSLTGISSPVRGVFSGGSTPTIVNIIEYITIASIGNVVDFGDLTNVRVPGGGTSNSIRGVLAGGNPATDAPTNNIDYITISSTGNAQDFGDLTYVVYSSHPGCSDSHGGLG